jgi:hypothetical protein
MHRRTTSPSAWIQTLNAATLSASLDQVWLLKGFSCERRKVLPFLRHDILHFLATDGCLLLITNLFLWESFTCNLPKKTKRQKKNNVLETTLSRAIFRQFVSQKKGRSLVSNKNQTCVPWWTCISLKPHLYLAGSTWNVARNIQMIQSLSRPTSLWHSLAIYTPSTSLPFVSSCCQLFPTLFSTSQLVLALSCLLDISRSLLAISLHFVGWWHIKNI